MRAHNGRLNHLRGYMNDLTKEIAAMGGGKYTQTYGAVDRCQPQNQL